MCLAPSIPKPPTPPAPPKSMDEVNQKADTEQRRRAMLMAGLQSTQRTGGLGLASNANVAVKTLLGQ